MRLFAVMLGLFGMGAVAMAQNDLLPPDRYGIPSNLKLYSQSDPKATLETVAKLLQLKRYDYLLAQVVDPAAVDPKVEERARVLFPQVDKEFQDLREFQKRNRDRFERDQLLPLDPVEFGKKVDDEAKRRAFKVLLKDVEKNLDDFPENVKLYRKFVREGVFNDFGGMASFILKDMPDQRVFLKRDGRRWLVEDRKVEIEKPAPPVEK